MLPVSRSRSDLASRRATRGSPDRTLRLQATFLCGLGSSPASARDHREPRRARVQPGCFV